MSGLLAGAVGAVARPWPVLAGAALAVAWVAAVDPGEPGHYPLCPVRDLTGLFCPGCGTLRAVHALTHGRVERAAGFNVLVLGLLPLLAVSWLAWASPTLRGYLAPASRHAAVARWWPWALLTLVLAFGVLRNLAWGAGLAP